MDFWVPPKPAIIIPASKELLKPSVNPRISSALTMFARTGFLRHRVSTAGNFQTITFVSSVGVDVSNGGTMIMQPPIVNVGDIVIAFLCGSDEEIINDEAQFEINNNGWVRIGNFLGVNTIHSELIYKIADSDIEADYNFNFDTGSTADSACGIIFVFSGVDPTTPIDVTIQQTNSTRADPDPPQIVPATPGACITAWGASNTTGVIDLNNVANYLPEPPEQQQAPDDINTSVAAMYRILVGGAGVAEDPPAFESWDSGDCHLYTVALRPAPA